MSLSSSQNFDRQIFKIFELYVIIDLIRGKGRENNIKQQFFIVCVTGTTFALLNLEDYLMTKKTNRKIFFSFFESNVKTLINKLMLRYKN